VLVDRAMAGTSLLNAPSRRVLLAVEDVALGELLLEALDEAGHRGELVLDEESLITAVAGADFDAAIVDLDTRGRRGAGWIGLLRARCPTTTLIALLPCGGLRPGEPAAPYHLSVEKPARLQALLTALAGARPAAD
jgi:hypothetical protein